MFGLGPVGVDGAFDVPFRHFAFDHPGCGSGAAGRVEAIEDAAQDGLPVGVNGGGVIRGEKRPAGRWIDARCAVWRRS
jgi:hypothetical protein